jgi:hypothetical protein
MKPVMRVNLLTRTSQFFYENSNLKVAILFTALFVIYLVLVMTRQAIGFETPNSNVRSLGMTFGFEESDILAFFQSRTNKMISAYVNFNLVWDSIFALIYGVMYAVWLSVLLKKFSRKFGILNLIPFLQVMFDLLENYSLAFLAQQYLSGGAMTSYMVDLSSYFVMMKWAFSGLTYFTLILGAGFLISRIVKKN